MREMRASQQSRDLNLAIVLISSVVMFLICHIPRLITSIYEVVNIHSILHCREQGKDKTPLWFIYVTATVQLLMVRTLDHYEFKFLFLSTRFQLILLMHYNGPKARNMK